MSNSIKKVSAVALSITTAAWLMGAVFVPVASAATVEELQVQINALLQKISELQGQLSQAQPSAAPAYTFTKSLTIGSKGDDVTALQSYLESKGFLTMPTGVAKGYFGSLTQKAVAAWQAANGVSPASGYFGSISRAKYTALTAAAPTTPTTPTTPTGPVAPATGLAASLASDNPAAGSLVAGASQVKVLKIALTAGTSGGVTVNTIKFTKSGVVSDTAINNAYLTDDGKVIAQYSSISGGVITFSNINLGINAGQTKSLSLRLDPASSGITAGNTISYNVSSASDISAVDSSSNAITASGTFPLMGNTQTVTTVSSPSIATLTIASSSVGTSVYAGTKNVLVSAWTTTVANSSVKLTSIKYTVVGSADKSHIQNIKLMVNGVQVGSTLPALASDGTAYFDLSASPAVLSTGSANVQIYADVMGSPSFNFDFGILNTFDVYAVDSTYNVGVPVTVTGGSTGSTSGHQITINAGSATVTAASDTPTGNIARGASGVTLAKYTIYAAGEAVKVKYLDFTLTFTGTTGTISNIVKNISLVDDAGGQVGSTISTPPSSYTTCTGSAAAPGYTSGSTTGGTYSDCFGTSSSNINYIVPANTTRTLSLKGDIQTGAAFTTIAAALSGNTNNLQGLTSSQSASSGAASGAALTLATNSLTAAKNSAVGTLTYAKGTSNALVGSYVMTASAAEGVNVSNITITGNASTTNFQNMLVKVDGVQFGSTKSTLSGSDIVTFSGTTFTVPVGGSKTINVYADILSSATANTMGTLTTLTSCVGSGASTYASISCAPTSIAGQSITVATGPTMTVTLSSQTASTKQVVMGSTNNSLATFRFTDTAGIEPIKITKLIVSATSTNAGGQASFGNVGLYSGSTALVSGVSASSTTGTSGWNYVFNLATPIVVPQLGATELEVKGDVASYISQAASSSATYTFRIASSTTDITAFGQSSNTALTTANMTLSPAPIVGNTITVLRTKLTLSAATLGATSGRSRTAYDDVANLTFNADPAYSATVNTVTLKFQGMAVSTGTAITANLIDPSTGTDWSSGSSSSCTTASNSCSMSFTYTGTNIPLISGSKTVKVRVNSSSFYNASQTSDSMTVSVDAAGSVNWGDGATTNGLSLQATDVPVVVANVSYE